MCELVQTTGAGGPEGDSGPASPNPFTSLGPALPHPALAHTPPPPVQFHLQVILFKPLLSQHALEHRPRSSSRTSTNARRAPMTASPQGTQGTHGVRTFALLLPSPLPPWLGVEPGRMHLSPQPCKRFCCTHSSFHPPYLDGAGPNIFFPRGTNPLSAALGASYAPSVA